MRKCLVYTLVILLLFSFLSFINFKIAKAEDLNDVVDAQLEEIDLSALEEYVSKIGYDGDVVEQIKSMLNGDYTFEYSSLSNYSINLLLHNIKKFIPIAFSLVAIAIFFSIVNNFKGSFFSEGVTEILFFACFCASVVIVTSQIVSFGIEIKNTIENLAILCEIMSPIIITLMIASGGNVSAGIYTPAVTFLSGGIINFILSFILPIIELMLIFDLLSSCSKNIKLKKFSDFLGGIIKWTLGIILTIFSVFITVRGIAGGMQDGVSSRALKYVISNSVPIVGGFIGGSFDLIVAGSVLIKNAVGVAVIFLIFFTILSPITYLGAFSIIMKLCSAIIESFSEIRLSEITMATHKHVSYFVAILSLVGLMIFITVLLMIFTANAFV